MPATYTKLKSGEWGIRVTGAKPKPGASISVTKKDGSTKSEVVANVIASFDNGSTHLCAVRKPGEQPAVGGYRSSRRPSRSRTCPTCGGNEENQVECMDCA